MIQGVSILDDEVLIVDESQLITREYMSMILSRMSEGSKLFLLGDLHQTYSTIDKQRQGLPDSSVSCLCELLLGLI